MGEAAQSGEAVSSPLQKERAAWAANGELASGLSAAHGAKFCASLTSGEDTASPLSAAHGAKFCASLTSGEDTASPLSAADRANFLRCAYEAERIPFLHYLRARLAAEPALGVGEIGLDRLKERTVSPQMRAVFVAQLALAAEFRRPVVLHGAKCWGQVVAEIKKLLAEDIPSFLFHGFSRSDGLLPDIVALNGFVSVGPAVLNDHAVNYRALVKKIPLDRLVVETDRTPENAATCPSVVEVAKKVAELRGLSLEELERVTDANAARFAGAGREARCR